MLKISLLLFLSLSLSLFSSCGGDDDIQNEAAATKESVPAAQFIAQADDLFKQREDIGKIRDGIGLLRRVRNSDPKNFEAVWRLSKFNFILGKYTTDEKESDKAFRDGVEAGRAASALEANKPDGYFWTGANLGGQAQKSPLTAGLTNIGEIRQTMNKVVEIDPGYQGANAYDALAQIEIETRLTGGKPEKAIEYLQAALKLEKENGYIYLHLAEANLALDNKAEAKKNIDYLLKMKPDPDFLPEQKECVEKAEKMLKTRF